MVSGDELNEKVTWYRSILHDSYVCMLCYVPNYRPLPIIGISFLLGVRSEGVEPQGALVIGQRPQVEVIELKGKRKLLHYLSTRKDKGEEENKQK